MATEANITSDFFVGEDKQLSFTVLQSDNETPQDVSGWTFVWNMRRTDYTTGSALIEKTSGSGVAITGVYNADPDLNTQRVVVTLTDTDTATLTPRLYRHALKRSNDGSETVVSYGDLMLLGVTAR